MRAEFLTPYRTKTVPWGFGDLSYVVFKRTYARPIPEEGRSEEWWETVARVVDGAIAIGADLTEEEAERLYDYAFNLKGLPGGRVLWQLGTENNRRLGADSLTNCFWTELRTVEDFGWLFERLMLGAGVGFSVQHGDELGVVEHAVVTNQDTADADFIVPDKREGWAELLVRTLRAYLNHGGSFTYSTILVRPEGTPIKTFGGTASGPGILVEGVGRITGILDGAVGRTLTSVEVLDIGNIIGAIVVSGNVRRSAEIAIGRPDDVPFLMAKRWDEGLPPMPVTRAMSNNSLEVEDFRALPDLVWEGYTGNGEPYGFVNVVAARKYRRTGDESRPDHGITGFNPCGEIALRDRESCNLAELFLPRIDSEEELHDLTRLLYKVQKAIAALPYLDAKTTAVAWASMKLGLGVGGVAQALGKLAWLSRAYEMLDAFDTEWSGEHGWPNSIRLTTVKPSGTISLLAGITPGVHPGFSTYHVRRVRMADTDPLVAWCRDRGYPVEPDVVNPRTAVVEFPCRFPEDTVTADKMTAVDLLHAQAILQREWADNAVSISVYYRPEELPEIREWLGEHWSEVKSVSFVLHEGHNWAQAPLEALTRAEYDRRVAELDLSREGVLGGVSWLLDGEECATGACPVR